MKETKILLGLQMPKTDSRLLTTTQMHRSLEFEDFESLDDFMQAHRVDYESYLKVLRAGISRPKVPICKKTYTRQMD